MNIFRSDQQFILLRFLQHRLARLLPDFFAQYPDITIELSVSDQRIDPISERVDVTIRVGPLADSELIAVPLGEVRRIIAASPHYLAARGTPQARGPDPQHPGRCPGT